MLVHALTKRAATLVVALFGCVGGSLAVAPATASAGITGTVSSAAQQSVGSGSWAAVGTTATTPPYGTGPLTLSFTAGGKKAPPPQYFMTANTGTLPLLQATYAVTVTGGVSTVLEACSTTWQTSNDTCPGGTITTLLTTTSTASVSTATAPLTVGSSIQLRMRVKVAKSTTATLNVSVSRAQVRTATTTYS